MKKHRLTNIFAGTYSVFVFLFLYAPIVVLMATSFNDSKFRNKWGGFTLKWYSDLFHDSVIMTSLRNTVLLALFSAVIATVIGTFAAIGIYYLRKGIVKTALMNLTYIPMLSPDIVTGISLLLLFTFFGITLGFKSLLLAHITFNIPYVILSVMPKLRQMNQFTYEAALDLGMRPFQAVNKVIIPEIFPGIISGFLLALTLSIDDFVISFFTTGPGVSTLSITIYSMTRRGIKPEINALSTLMFATVLTLLIIINLRNSKMEKAESLNNGGNR
ncbi:MAG: ABC transporter permease subunit [Bacillota bacterium]|nr:ABC transporter permease subunit [Bacillota bacterium]